MAQTLIPDPMRIYLHMTEIWPAASLVDDETDEDAREIDDAIIKRWQDANIEQHRAEVALIAAWKAAGGHWHE